MTKPWTPKRIKRVLSRHGLSLRQLAAALGTTAPQVLRWTTGERGIPFGETLDKALSMRDRIEEIEKKGLKP